MKKTIKKLCLMFPILLILGCTNEISPDLENNSSCKIRSKEEACKLAEEFLDKIGSTSLETRSSNDIADVKIVYGSTSRNSSDTLMYAVNLKANGYLIVSAPVNAEPILAYVEKGYFNGCEETNTGFDEFMEFAKDYVEKSSSPGIPVTPPDFPPGRLLPYEIHDIVYPKTDLEWGQDTPEGKFCPNKKAGCEQTAMAMALAYFEEPKTLKLTYEGRPFGELELNWSDIKKHKNICAEECSASEESHDALGYLCRELGELNEAEYDKYDTSAPGYNRSETLQKLIPGVKLKQLGTPVNYVSVFCHLYSENGVAIFSGLGKDGFGGHVWLCEGGIEKTFHTAVYFDDGTEDVRVQYYLYFNWSWNGMNNGYFYSGVYDTEQSMSLGDVFNDSMRKVGSRYDFGKRVNCLLISKD